jgi:hypothetical protein
VGRNLLDGTIFDKLSEKGSHDSGMFTRLNPGLKDLIQHGKFNDELSDKAIIDVGTPVVHFLIRSLETLKLSPERIIMNVANTQKDDFTSQLRIGARYFDFRPGWCCG